jgi:hypothetical protein
MHQQKTKKHHSSLFKPRLIVLATIMAFTVSGLIVFLPTEVFAANSICLTMTSRGGAVTPSQTPKDCTDQGSPILVRLSRMPAGTIAENKCYTITENEDDGSAPLTVHDADCTQTPFSNFCQFFTGKACFADSAAQATSGGAIPAQSDPAASACGNDAKDVATETNSTLSNGCGLVNKYVQPLINVLAAAIGVVATINIIIGGIQYSAASGDPQKVAAARKRIANSVLALVAFGLLYAFMQWLIPGGFL